MKLLLLLFIDFITIPIILFFIIYLRYSADSHGGEDDIHV